jgi:hypothetical protein
MLKMLPLSCLTVSRPMRAARHFNRAQRPSINSFPRSIAVSVAFVLFCVIACSAEAANFTASLDRDNISLGESATLTLTFENGQPARMPVFPNIPNLRIEDSGGDSVRTVNINGNFTSSRMHTYSVAATQQGKYTIPALSVTMDGQTYTSQPLTLTVGKVSTVSSDTAFLKLIVPKTQVYVGEVLPVEIQLYFQGARGLEAPHINEEGFTLGKLVQGNESATVVNGRRYDILPLKTYVVPAKAGNIALGPATMDLQIVKSNSRVNFFGQPVDFQPVSLHSQPETLQVLPLPHDNVPPTFNGAVGAFSLSVSASPTNVAVGDPVTVKIQISGTGSLDGVTLPTQESWQQFKLYPPTSEFQPADQLGVSGTKTFSLTAVPQNLDIKELPPFSFSFFDPNQKTYRTITQPAIPLIVRPSAASLPAPVLAANNSAESQPATNDVAPLKVRIGSVRRITPPLAVQPSFLALQCIPVLAWLALFLNRRRKENLANNPRLRRQLQVAHITRHGLKQLQDYARANQAAEFFSTLFHLLQEQLGERLDVPASSITESIVDERLRPLVVNESTLALLAELFHACNQARYAPQSTNEELVSLIPKAEAALREIKKIKI